MNKQNSSNRPIWQAEKDYPELCEALRNGLQEVLDPEIGLNVIQLGMIRDVTINNDNAMVQMILTTPYCPFASIMLENTRQKAETILKRPTSMELIKEVRDFSMLADENATGQGQ